MQVWVTHCSAWAPGLESAEQWADFRPDCLPETDAKPAAAGVPAMTRRRLTRWGRQALEVAEPACESLAADAPVIFSSRHGDTERTFKLLQALATDAPLSPNGFSLSVHNSALGIFSIIKKIQAPSVALAAGRDTLAAAWREAETWLQQGARQVLLVHSEEPLAEFYRDYADEREMPAALALVLSAQPEPAAPSVCLTMEDAGESAGHNSLLIEFLAWWHGSQQMLTADTGNHRWCWRRGAAQD
ncbi:beta-ketoacyl synthase chain length factor [Gilvimarinus xylanilyticus]|uniref:Beta-ketoacyl synthase chain length factor n=1 Tax=Gilvimarinus xylanilyticus TaxID=2944139 RepID=A0A9X2HXC8_9GAMM|nr:beta-ketoacyl synthase chain length factor [Gilvimarinus xylanilyticus]MCP8900138.1 beta-ketoacyl synthase chain length factor [Gilvimarinus xylanilyticus]